MTSTAKTLLLALAGTIAASGAVAEPRYNPLKMQCADVKQVIRENGAVTLRYMSTRVRNLPLYNRYVRNTNYCPSGQVATPANVPSADNPHCPVNICEYRSYDDDRIIIAPSPN